MNPYRSVQMRVLLGQLEDIGKVRQVYGYAQGIANLCRLHVCQYLWQARLKFWEIEMAMGVYEHDWLF
jgi:hypothetical protein